MKHKLSAAPVGSVARILSISVGGQLRKRLIEMGVLPGVVVEVVRFAPLGDPMELRIRGTSLSLRKAEASCIEVQLIERPAPARNRHRHGRRNGNNPDV